VPRVEQFEEVLAAVWRTRHPDVALRFVAWDCYSSDPPADLDVFVFDAVFLERFRRRGLLQPLPAQALEPADDFLPAATAAAIESGGLWGVPQFLCADLLLYREGDEELERAEGLADVVAALGRSTAPGPLPPAGDGLLVDLSDPGFVGLFYVQAYEDRMGQYTEDPPLPWRASRVNAEALRSVRALLRMAGAPQARYVAADQFQRARWFGQGHGRALVSFAEGLSALGADEAAETEFKLLPLANGQDVPLFYVDLAAVNSALGTGDGRTLALATELVALMGSPDVMLASLQSRPGDASPQYILPARRSVFRGLAQTYPVYAELYRLVRAAGPRPFLLGTESRTWLKGGAPTIWDLVYAGS
jgi:thiamine pyridinylase